MGPSLCRSFLLVASSRGLLAVSHFCVSAECALLSSILHIFFRERSQPLDPDYVSEAACAALLTKQSGLYALLEKAVTDGDGYILWDCGECHMVIVTPRVC